MKHHAAEIGATGIDGRRKQKIQRQMMQRDGDAAGEDRAIVAIGGQTSQRGEEVHMRIDLPGMSGKLIGEHRDSPISATAKIRRVERPLPELAQDAVAAIAIAATNAVGASQPLSRIKPMASAIGT